LREGGLTTGRIHPIWGLFEIAVMAGLFLVVLWVVGPHVGSNSAALAFYWATLAIWAVVIVWLSPIVLHRDAPGLRGWGGGRSPDDPGAVPNAWRAYAGLTAIAAVALMVAVVVRDPAFAVHTRWPRVARKLLIYLVYGPIQALVFFGYIQTRVRTALGAFARGRLTGRPMVALLTAALFAGAHAPNWPLVLLTFVAGMAWSWLYYARPSVLLLGVSHAVLGTIVYSLLGISTRIGPFYAHPEGHIVRDAIPGLSALVGDLF